MADGAGERGTLRKPRASSRGGQPPQSDCRGPGCQGRGHALWRGQWGATALVWGTQSPEQFGQWLLGLHRRGEASGEAQGSDVCAQGDCGALPGERRSWFGARVCVAARLKPLQPSRAAPLRGLAFHRPWAPAVHPGTGHRSRTGARRTELQTRPGWEEAQREQMGRGPPRGLSQDSVRTETRPPQAVTCLRS